MKQRCSLTSREEDVPQALALKFAHFPESGSLSLTLPGAGPVVLRASGGSLCPHTGGIRDPFQAAKRAPCVGSARPIKNINAGGGLVDMQEVEDIAVRSSPGCCQP